MSRGGGTLLCDLSDDVCNVTYTPLCTELLTGACENITILQLLSWVVTIINFKEYSRGEEVQAPICHGVLGYIHLTPVT